MCQLQVFIIYEIVVPFDCKYQEYCDTKYFGTMVPLFRGTVRPLAMSLSNTDDGGSSLPVNAGSELQMTSVSLFSIYSCVTRINFKHR